METQQTFRAINGIEYKKKRLNHKMQHQTLLINLYRWGSKPVSVFKSVIYLRNLPPDIGRAALICQYIWSCRSWYHTHSTSLPYVVSSYLAFSPSSLWDIPSLAVIFCYGIHKITPICAFRSRMLFPVRTFLTGPKTGATNRLTYYYNANLSQFSEIFK